MKDWKEGTVNNFNQSGLISFKAGVYGNLISGGMSYGLMKGVGTSLVPKGANLYTRYTVHGLFLMIDANFNLAGNMSASIIEREMKK